MGRLKASVQLDELHKEVGKLRARIVARDRRIQAIAAAFDLSLGLLTDALPFLTFDPDLTEPMDLATTIDEFLDAAVAARLATTKKESVLHAVD